MTPQFAKAVDPVFMYVIRLLDRIENYKRDEPDRMPNPDLERHELINRLNRAQDQLANSSDWQLAKYAIIAWIDDSLIFADWSGSAAWQEDPLEVQIYGPRIAATEFFEKAKQAQSLHNKDALEIFYVCVMLGFYGAYRLDALGARDSDDHRMILRERDLPPSREAWAKEMRAYLRLKQGLPPLAIDRRESGSAAALEERSNCIASWMVFIVLSATVFFTAWYLFYVRVPS